MGNTLLNNTSVFSFFKLLVTSIMYVFRVFESTKNRGPKPPAISDSEMNCHAERRESWSLPNTEISAVAIEGISHLSAHVLTALHVLDR